MGTRRTWLVAVTTVIVATVVGAASPMAASATPARSALLDSRCTIEWRATGPDHLWSTPANWEAASGPDRVPGPDDIICGQFVRRGIVDVPFTVRELWGEHTTTVRSSLTVTSNASFQDLVVEGGGTLDSFGTSAWSIRASGGSGTATIRVGNLNLFGELSVLRPLDVFGSLDLQGPTSVTGAGVLHLAGRYRPQYQQYLLLQGRLHVASPASVVAEPGLNVETRTTARLEGALPAFPAASVFHRAPFELRVSGRSTVSGVTAGATVRVVPGAPGDAVLNASDANPNTGTVVLDGTATAPVAATIDQNEYGRYANAGTLVMDHATLRGPFDNRGVVRLGAGAVVEAEHSAYHYATVNTGYLLVGGPADPGTSRATATIDGQLVNTGAILADAPAGILEVPRNGLALAGTVTAALRLRQGAGMAAPIGYRSALGDLALDGGSGVAGTVDGRSAERSGVVRAATLTASPDAAVVFQVATYFAPCAGDRWPILTWKQRSAPPIGGVPTTVQTDGLVRFETRHDALIAVVQRSYDPSANCAASARDRFTARVYVEGLGRSPGQATLTAAFAKVATVAGRRSLARTVLVSDEARNRAIDAEYVRVTGARPTVGSRAIWLQRFKAGAQPRELRAALYGTPAYRNRTGTTIEAFVTGLYAAEQAGPVPAAALDLARRRTAAGATRAQVAAELLARPEVVDALVTRSTRVWWGRAPTTAERTTWRARFATDVEGAVLADLIAAAPLT